MSVLRQCIEVLTVCEVPVNLDLFSMMLRSIDCARNAQKSGELLSDGDKIILMGGIATFHFGWGEIPDTLRPPPPSKKPQICYISDYFEISRCICLFLYLLRYSLLI